MNEIQIFKHAHFGAIRTMMMPDGQVGFVGKDVAEVLGYQNGSRDINRHVDTEDRMILKIYDGCQNRDSIFINESGLYSLILSSKLPKAREFKHWVTSKVLPQIRKTGGYININDDDDENTIMARALMIAQKTIAQKDDLLEAQRPKVRFADSVVSADDSILIRDLAKLLTQNGYVIGQNRLFDFLRKQGYIFKNETRPMQRYVEQGLFDTTVTIIETHHGAKERVTTKVTGKGQEYFLNGFKTGRFCL